MLWVEIFDIALGVLTLATQIGIVIFILLYFFGKKTKIYAWISSKKGVIAFSLLFAATLGSLIYSEVMQLEPCRYCWWQRILIYPQVFIVGLALIKREIKVIKKYCILLSSLGAIMAGYHYLSQKFAAVAETTNCNIYTVDCSSAYVNAFGYITIPMMSLTVLVGVLLLMTLSQKSN